MYEFLYTILLKIKKNRHVIAGCYGIEKLKIN